MKKILVICMVCVFLLSGCTTRVETVNTKVMYAISDGAHNYGNFTLLVNADGTPMLYEGGDE